MNPVTGITSPNSIRGAVEQHILHAYIQFHDWRALRSMSLNPLDYGIWMENEYWWDHRTHWHYDKS